MKKQKTKKTSHVQWLESCFHNWRSVWMLSFCLVLSLGQLQKIALGNTFGSAAIYLHDLFAVGLVGWSCWRDHSWRTSVISFIKKMLPFSTAIVVLALCGWASGLIQTGSVSAVGIGILYTIRLGIYLATLSIVASWIQRRQLAVFDLLMAGEWFGIFVLGFGFLQYLFFPDLRFLIALGWDDHYFRLVSTLLDPGFTGMILAIGWWWHFLFVQWWQKHHVQQTHSSLFKILAISGSLLFAVGILLTYSRASYLAFGLSLLGGLLVALLQFRKQPMFIFLILASGLLFILGIPALPRPGGEGVKLERTSTIIARQDQVELTLKNWSTTTWLIGQGLFVSGAEAIPQQHARIPDNSILFIIQSAGVIGLFFAAAASIALMKKAVAKHLYIPMIVTAAVGIHSLFNASVVYPFVIIYLGLFWIATR